MEQCPHQPALFSAALWSALLRGSAGPSTYRRPSCFCAIEQQREKSKKDEKELSCLFHVFTRSLPRKADGLLQKSWPLPRPLELAPALSSPWAASTSNPP